MEDDGSVVVGVDGCPGGWVAAILCHRSVQWRVLPDAAAILAAGRSAGAAAIAVDIPIGLPEPGADVRRRCDLHARDFLRPWAAQSSVFFTPVRAVLGAGSYSAANELSRRLTGSGLSRQTWNILDRVAAIDTVLGETPKAPVIEVHPEVSFRILDPSIDTSKKSARGAGQRISALARVVDIGALADLPAGPRLDDCLDAVVASWSARRWSMGTARVFGLRDDGSVPTDVRDRPMRIVA